MAGALEFVEAMPAGFDTVVGERGGRLSGGQRQRIALARALYRQPDLLILDEPTSALDSESEAAVRAALENIKGSTTMLIVAHRLDTVRFCDRIVAIDGGQVVEDGDWSTLAARPDSVLSRMLAAQKA
jgi:ABC-type multidrug transport system fused ATPase/permease subunit